MVSSLMCVYSGMDQVGEDRNVSCAVWSKCGKEPGIAHKIGELKRSVLTGIGKTEEARGDPSGHHVRLCRRSTGCCGAPKMLEIPEPRVICQGKSHTDSGSSQRGVCAAGAKMEGGALILDRGATGLGICTSGIWCCFGPVFLHYVKGTAGGD